MVRVAGLRGQARSEFKPFRRTGSRPGEQLDRIKERVIELTDQQMRRWRELRRDIEEVGIVIVDPPISPRRIASGWRIIFSRASFRC